MLYNYEGTVQEVLYEKIESKGKSYDKAIVAVKEDSEYNNLAAFEFFGDKASEVKEIKEGDKVTVSFAIRGNKYNGRYFSNVSGIKIWVKDGTQGDYSPNKGANSKAMHDLPDDAIPNPTQEETKKGAETDDLPFS